MPILIDIETTSPQIFDTNGEPGFGQVTIKPSQSFTYFDGVNTILVGDSSVSIPVENGQLTNPLQLAPNKGAVNTPETYYQVVINVNGQVIEQAWQIDAATVGPVEFGDVAKLPTSADPNDPVEQLTNAQNPFRQYVLRNDTVESPVIGEASDGRGYIPRVDPLTGKLDPSFVLGPGGIQASDIPLVDIGGYYVGNEDVEAALQQVGQEQVDQDALIANKVDRDGDLGLTGNQRITGGSYQLQAPAPANDSVFIVRSSAGVEEGYFGKNRNNADDYVYMANLLASSQIRLLDSGGTNGIQYIAGSTNTIKHTGNFVVRNRNVSGASSTGDILDETISLPAGTYYAIYLASYSYTGDVNNPTALLVVFNNLGGTQTVRRPLLATDARVSQGQIQELLIPVVAVYDFDHPGGDANLLMTASFAGAGSGNISLGGGDLFIVRVS